MLGHLGVNVPDLKRAKSYYGEVMPLLGFETLFASGDEVAYMPAGDKRGTYLFFYAAQERGAYSRHQPGL